MVFSQADDIHELHTHDKIILAIISNVTQPPEKIDHTVDLTSTDISENDFLQIFFNYSTHHFHINNSNSHNYLLSLKNKLYISHANQKIAFNLPQLVISHLSNAEYLTNNSISSLSKLSALKQASHIHSLAQVRGFQKALTWFEIIDLLISSDIIAHSSNPLDVAYTHLTVQFIFVEASTNMSIAINFNFNVAMPCYTNPHHGPPIPCHYSNDEKNHNHANNQEISRSKPTIKQLNHVKEIVHNYEDDDNSVIQHFTPVKVDDYDNSIIKQFNSVKEDDDDDDDESVAGVSITNSIMQQIKMVQQDTSSDEDSENLSISIDGDESSAWA